MHKSLDEFEFRPDPTTEYGVSCPSALKKIDVTTFSPLLLIQSFSNFAGNEDMHNFLDEFEFWPDLTTDYGVSCP